MAHTTMTQPRRESSLLLHLFIGLFSLSYFVKGALLLFSSERNDILPLREPILDYQFLALYAICVALAFLLLTGASYVFFRRYFASPGSNVRADDLYLPGSDALLLSAACLGLILFFNWNLVIAKLGSGAVFARQLQYLQSQFYSGSLGLSAFVLAFITSLNLFLVAQAVITRSRLSFWLCAATIFVQAVVSDGSRFTLAGSLIVVPVIIVYAWRIRLNLGLIYVAVLVVLPISAGALQFLRYGGSVNVLNLFKGFVSTFDAADHLVAYLNHVPWSTGQRAFEEFLQMAPRVLLPEKPVIYGMLSLQDAIYDARIGGATGAYTQMHYPLSIVVMALDSFPVIGFVLGAAATGLLLAFLATLIERPSPIAIAIAAWSTINLYHLIRAGLTNFVIAFVLAMAPALMFFIAWTMVRRRMPTQTIHQPQSSARPLHA